jgi:hypothetical protein
MEGKWEADTVSEGNGWPTDASEASGRPLTASEETVWVPPNPEVKGRSPPAFGGDHPDPHRIGVKSGDLTASEAQTVFLIALRGK